jgi:hypothetical protein
MCPYYTIKGTAEEPLRWRAGVTPSLRGLEYRLNQDAVGSDRGWNPTRG